MFCWFKKKKNNEILLPESQEKKASKFSTDVTLKEMNGLGCFAYTQNLLVSKWVEMDCAFRERSVTVLKT